ncbi:hypothetical protein WJX81_003478 [Elliptochloris bilobata]|uniref:GDP-Man:Man(3)GlcNAc(2)-PP-Dol alpha-1,2-mannosyltransferase n=1 Tax=Elliptochloris bilobata TaxID=381761 RepID=A0AAW1RDX1_9CHLO
MLLSLAAPAFALLVFILLFGLDTALWAVLWLSCLVLFAALGLRKWLRRVLPPKQEGVIAFFHPNANGGGGGERVLWAAVKAVQETFPLAKVVIYLGDSLSGEQLRKSALSGFNVELPRSIEVVKLAEVDLLKPERYPHFTLVGQAAGSVGLGLAALRRLVPEVMVDTSGWAFAYPLARLAGVRVAAYVHYPTVSADMLAAVVARRPGFNNDPALAASWARSAAKLAYYCVFAAAYGAAGGCANAVMVNSSWTAGHIARLWWRVEPPLRVFPPCDTAALAALPLDRKLKRLYLVSLAQFRPEKDHAMQLRAFSRARRRAAGCAGHVADAVLAARLVLIGGCRGPADEARAADLRVLADQLGLGSAVDFAINVPFSEVTALLAGAVGGLHTMRDEHFGISVVQYMAAGVVPIAHNSGGPAADIVTLEEVPGGLQATGYLCASEDEFAAAITDVLAMDQVSRLRLAAAARRKAAEFSDARFAAGFLEALQPLLPPRMVTASSVAVG